MLFIKTSSVAFSFLFTQTVGYLNLFLLYSMFVTKIVSKKQDLSLIYFRLAIDMVYSFCACSIQGYYICRQINDELVIKNLSFFLTWPTNVCITIRPILVILINQDRIFATCFPISYHIHRHKISTSDVSLFLLACALFNQYILFGYCRNVIDVPLECDNFKCTVNECYYGFWLSFEHYSYVLIVILSATIVIRLYMCYLKGTQLNAVFARATLIALIDSIIILTFNALPPTVLKQFPNINFDTVGPVLTAFKNAGFVIEAFIVLKIMFRETNLVNTINN
ncbi:Serpentine Receptor, class BC (Class B-like) [Caenorhabditis elegans]|uniref:Serpentine Receptor, class BC (Class B-like) n=1 Tax=Caenorhabditis elegans TaxID=6239 RepID=O62362_CAEEL|nr:Serpentine Receptor, class BC (Class B-like) [Caenorhabditis elegans]CAB03321.1 Serpentine Receptor, class BC (Class B-like) [Caenorhabditis elegans]|eukprot:NP_506832.1 Serpentine Receptor, class BC (class B-like) [Caenorhabditis elegans]